MAYRELLDKNVVLNLKFGLAVLISIGQSFE